MKSVFKRWLNHVVVLLGFSTCGMMTGCVMYGVPNVDYKITGTVTDEENNPIEGIRVTLPQLNANLERIWHYDLSREDMSQWSAEDIASMAGGICAADDVHGRERPLQFRRDEHDGSGTLGGHL